MSPSCNSYMAICGHAMSDPSGFQQSLTFAFHSCLSLLPFSLAFHSCLALCPLAAALWLPPGGFCTLTFPHFSFCPLAFSPLTSMLWLAPLRRLVHPHLAFCSSFCSFCHVGLADEFWVSHKTTESLPIISIPVELLTQGLVMYVTQIILCLHMLHFLCCTDQVFLSPNSCCPDM